jgi:hypothetical protein
MAASNDHADVAGGLRRYRIRTALVRVLMHTHALLYPNRTGKDVNVDLGKVRLFDMADHPNAAAFLPLYASWPIPQRRST